MHGAGVHSVELPLLLQPRLHLILHTRQYEIIHESPKRHAGLSLRTQELTMIFLVIRLYCRCLPCPHGAGLPDSCTICNAFHVSRALCSNFSCI